MADTRKRRRSRRQNGIEGSPRLNDLRAMDRWDERDAGDVLAIWEQAGVSLLRFSRDTGISYDRLTHWKRRLDKRAIESPFIEVAMPTPTVSMPNQGMDIILRNNRTIRVRPGFDGESLRALIGVLEETE